MRSLVILAGLALMTACDTSGGTVPTDPTYDGDIQPIFDAECVGCHGATHPSGGLSLTAQNGYASLVGVDAPGAGMPFVDPGNADNSYLMKRIEGTSGTRMPEGGAPLDQVTQDTIRTWIDNGAPQN